MASRWQSSAGSDARSATASDWSISARFVADSLESSVGTGQASSQVVRGVFSGVSMHGVATILPHSDVESRFPRVFAGCSSPCRTLTVVVHLEAR